MIPPTTRLETINHLPRPMRAIIRRWVTEHATWASLEDAYQAALQTFPGWFVYRGGSHIALHLADGDDRRILMIA